MTNETVKGFGDYTGIEAAKRQKIKGMLANIFKLYGFELSETPIIEFEEFVRGDNANDEAVGDVFRDEPPTGNRFRQFTQCDIDTVGSTLKEEAEILRIADEIMKELGIK